MTERSTGDLLTRGLSFPMSDDDWLVTNLIGGGLLLFSFLLLPMLAVQGFLVEVMSEALGEDDDIPEWGDFGFGVMMTGLKSLVLGFLYLLVPTAAFVAFFLLGIGAGTASGSQDLAGLFTAGGGLLFLVLLLAFGYVAPAAQVNFARERTIGAGFDFDTIFEVATSSEYVVGWVLAFIIIAVQGLVANLISLTIVGILFLPWVYFFFSVSTFYIYGRSFANALDLDSESPEGRGRTPETRTDDGLTDDDTRMIS
ncbi:DUF4013 domain-containing protein [Halorussus gelatinilyticus]|uniref:DUF4013 domain-containing protein n=1 Tax=Halorussus gelatinilyticus TaxID=2937524 RepID=A0A8U0IKT8_9EURY|nr:DUF4013 domain-containing protein [Halorussus gelatinilyticus]UPW00659.1 DUF4013 domain-containing protein [Halorussus gelatinilyticus]